MPNPLFSALGGNPMGNMMQMLTQLKQNPRALLQKAGFNIPTNLNSPQAIVQHLLNTNQITQQRLNQSQMMADRMVGRR